MGWQPKVLFKCVKHIQLVERLICMVSLCFAGGSLHLPEAAFEGLLGGGGNQTGTSVSKSWQGWYVSEYQLAGVWGRLPPPPPVCIACAASREHLLGDRVMQNARLDQPSEV